MVSRPVIIGAMAVVAPLLVALVVLLPRMGADGPLERYTKYMREHPELAMRMTVRVAGSSTPAEGSLRLRRPDHMLFRVRGGPNDYACLVTPKGIVETEAAIQTYDENDFVGGIEPPPGRLSGMPGLAFPFFLLRSDLRSIAPEGVEFKSQGREQLGGRGADVMVASTSPEGGGRADGPQGGPSGPMSGTKVTLRISVDDEGRLLRFQRLVEGPMGKRDTTWTFEHEAAPSGDFTLEIPEGYTPVALPEDGWPIQIGHSAPLEGWTDAATGAPANLSLSGPTLLALLGAESEPSRRALPSLDRLGKKLKVVILTDAATAEAARQAKLPGALFDPSGKSLQRLSAPATPLFLLVGPDGKVTKVWMGYDPKQATAFEGEVRAALSSP